MKIFKSLEESGLSIKYLHKTIKNEGRKQKGLLGMLLGILGARLLGNLLTVKGTAKAGEGAIATSQRQETVRAGQDFSCYFILQQILKYRSIIKISQNVIVFIAEMIYPK